jgi:hypothetical protein
MTDNNRKNGSSVMGTTRYGVKLCQRLTKWENSEIMGTWTVGYSGFVNDVGMKKEWIPQLRETWVALPGKEGHQGWRRKSYVYAGNKGFIQLPKK